MIFRNIHFFIISISLCFLFSNSKVTYGAIEHLLFNSNIIGERKVEIYRPINSPIDNQTIFIFMQDGQMLFDKSMTWNSQDWNIDEIFSKRTVSYTHLTLPTKA